MEHPNVTSPTGFLHQYVHRMSGKHSQTETVQHTSPVVFSETRDKVKSLEQIDANGTSEDPVKLKALEHRLDIGDEKSSLLGYEVFSGKLVLDKKTKTTGDDEQTGSGTGNSDSIDAKLTTKALIWGSHVLSLEDVISISYGACFRHFTVHSYSVRRRSYRLSCFMKPQRSQKDFRFVASSSEEAIKWVQSFADQQCYINCLPHPMMSTKKQTSNLVVTEALYDLPYIKCKSPPRLLVILNPHSGHGRSTLALKVLNGLLNRDDQKEVISVPIGIIPAGSDNSLVWTILGVRDPISAAMTIVKVMMCLYGLLIHVYVYQSAFDFIVLSEKFQKRFGPLRYFVAGFLKFLCLPKYTFELEYLPTSKELGNSKEKVLENQDKIVMSDLYTNIIHESRKEGIPRASSLSSIDSIMSPNRMSGGDMGTTGSTVASNEPSDYVRGLDPKLKHLSSGRNSLVSEPDEVLHPQPHLSANFNWPRTRSKSRTDKTWTGLTVTNDSRCSRGATSMYDKEDISSTVSDPGPIWDSEAKWDTGPKWDAEPNWEGENPVELPGPPDDLELGMKLEPVPSLEDKWFVKKGKFLGVLVCNHSCKTVQSLSSQVVAPKAVHDDNSLDLLLVGGSGRLRLLRFLICLQFGRHLSLPYVDYVKVWDASSPHPTPNDSVF
ncbi:hypothetical protein B296_00010669 [Ensete ventricosum]|uniref:DAGKc domain-containing protein n=1 Tax=Ensete ventricosum TaxID=4639 RepID=A0A426ZYV4_ENSVE|nr:hypothetical protein B296_00010669 [Ensete ventricosum]